MTQANIEQRMLPAPIRDAATAAYWDGAAKGELLVKQCTECSRFHWYPRPLCPYCLGDTRWVRSCGRGTIYSVSVTRRAGPVVYAVAYVTLEEGITLLTNIVDTDLDAVRIGMPVKVCFKTAEDGAAIPMFTPAC